MKRNKTRSKDLPKIIAITGSKMSGKDHIIKIWKELYKIPVFDADLAFRFTIHYDEEVKKGIKDEMGDIAFIKDRWLNKSFFDNDIKMEKILRLSEERVFNMFFKWSKRQESDYVLFKSSIVHELMNPINFHKIINVYAPTGVREMRYIRDSKGEDVSIIRNEMSSETKRELSDHTIHNYYNFSNRLNRQINFIHGKILDI